MYKSLFFGLIFILVGCVDGVSKQSIPQLNGYWEIKKVIFPDGNSKEYGVSTTIDYIQLDGLKGFRKKVQPKLDGTYDGSDDTEFFVINEVDAGFKILYKTEFSEWTETLVDLGANTFSVTNEDGIRYNYQRYEPIYVNE